MKDILKPGIPNEGFHFPSDYETMTVETAFRYLELSRDGHGLVFEPDNYEGFKKILVMKCGIDINYVFGPDYKEDIETIKKHSLISEVSAEELEKEVDKKIQEQEEEYKKMTKLAAIEEAEKRHRKLSLFKRLREKISGYKVDYDNLSTEEIKKLYK